MSFACFFRAIVFLRGHYKTSVPLILHIPEVGRLNEWRSAKLSVQRSMCKHADRSKDVSILVTVRVLFQWQVSCCTVACKFCCVTYCASFIESFRLWRCWLHNLCLWWTPMRKNTFWIVCLCSHDSLTEIWPEESTFPFKIAFGLEYWKLYYTAGMSQLLLSRCQQIKAPLSFPSHSTNVIVCATSPDAQHNNTRCSTQRVLQINGKPKQTEIVFGGTMKFPRLCASTRNLGNSIVPVLYSNTLQCFLF